MLTLDTRLPWELVKTGFQALGKCGALDHDHNQSEGEGRGGGRGGEEEGEGEGREGKGRLKWKKAPNTPFYLFCLRLNFRRDRRTAVMPSASSARPAPSRSESSSKQEVGVAYEARPYTRKRRKLTPDLHN